MNKKTFLYNTHEKLGAKIIPFAGYLMPVEYSGIINEHLCVRKHAGIFDVSHMGEFWVKGPNALNFLQKITTNDVESIGIGKVQYNCLPNGMGGIIDDLLIYKYDSEKYMLVVNASNMAKDWKWLNDNNSDNAILENASDDMGEIAVQGPKSIDILQKLTTINLSQMPYFSFQTGTFAGIDHVIISRTGYTGEKGFEIYFYCEHSETIWNKIMDAGKEHNLQPIGLGARDTLRLEAGLCLYGNDIDDTTSPIEANLGWITKFKEGKNFIDRDFLASQNENGTKRKLVGFEMIDRGIPRHGYEIEDAQGNIIGLVTSGTMSPFLNKGIGMAYIKSKFTLPGSTIYIKIRNKTLKAQVIKLPFYKNTN